MNADSRHAEAASSSGTSTPFAPDAEASPEASSSVPCTLARAPMLIFPFTCPPSLSESRTACAKSSWETARTFGGERIDGDWEYYERLTKFTRSGAFDTDPTLAGLQPEGGVVV